MIDNEKIIGLLEKAGLNTKINEEDFKKSFELIGLDSLDVFGFLSEVELAFDIRIAESDFQKLNSLSDVVTYLNQSLSN